ncbi:5-oxoprolinase subunit PxpB [Marinobacter halodurans]|uniref:5-oxoprolinase subunit PxpB n=1 Tax=Marinobacter halodurans TaxID=2528979 RepID=A0ABY1ZKJ7_9GAMM|nr:5-oxoprolinase subunit PxpB [Marinobacter halodurans]TBW56057.1 5-oxoprolinase subunit PxpB [Marinobacter halodurans]
MSIEPVSEDSVLIRFGDQLDEQLTPRILAAQARIASQLGDWIIDQVPAYTTLLVVYDLHKVDFRRVVAGIEPILAGIDEGTSAPRDKGRLIELPVYYHPEVGLDLEAVAERAGLTIEDVIVRHSATTYRVFAMGFAPGFGFMGTVDPSIATPRKSTPRQRVPAGSVGIANQQTAVYPSVSPGGWNIIGRCPTQLFSLERLSLLQAGDRVAFRAISRDEFVDQGGEL